MKLDLHLAAACLIGYSMAVPRVVHPLAANKNEPFTSEINGAFETMERMEQASKQYAFQTVEARMRFATAVKYREIDFRKAEAMPLMHLSTLNQLNPFNGTYLWDQDAQRRWKVRPHADVKTKVVDPPNLLRWAAVNGTLDLADAWAAALADPSWQSDLVKEHATIRLVKLNNQTGQTEPPQPMFIFGLSFEDTLYDGRPGFNVMVALNKTVIHRDDARNTQI